MGIIYEAIHSDTSKRVALKLVLRGQFFDERSAAWTKRFRREARAIGALETPHVVQVYDAGTDGETGQPFIAMELLKGVDLSRLLRGTGPLPPEVAVKILAQACFGVIEAHRHGVLHRDIKPSNLFLSIHDANVTVKVLDFGVAKITADPKLSRITLTGQLIGTPSYASPEQLRGDPVDERSDVWSLGAVLYKSLTGSVPHENVGGLVDLVLHVTRNPVRPVNDRAPWVPLAISQIAERALCITPDARYQTVRDMLEDLRAIVPSFVVSEGELAGLRPEDVAAKWASSQASSPTAVTKALTTGGITTPSREGLTRANPVRTWLFFFLAFSTTLVVLMGGALILLQRPTPKHLDRIVSTPVLPAFNKKLDAQTKVASEAPTQSEPVASAAPPKPIERPSREAARPKTSAKPSSEPASAPQPALTLEPNF
jgi:serine/threonine protein kinase